MEWLRDGKWMEERAHRVWEPWEHFSLQQNCAWDNKKRLKCFHSWNCALCNSRIDVQQASSKGNISRRFDGKDMNFGIWWRINPNPNHNYNKIRRLKWKMRALPAHCESMLYTKNVPNVNFGSDIFAFINSVYFWARRRWCHLFSIIKSTAIFYALCLLTWKSF